MESLICCESLGRFSTGEEILCYRLRGKGGAYCDIADLGGCVMRIVVPDRNNVLDDVIVGYDTVDSLEKWGGHFGKIVGRCANRIGQGRFVLGGKAYQLPLNNGENHLHGGPNGFNTKLWRGDVIDGSLVLSLLSPDGDEGYPGNLCVRITYGFDESNVLSIRYEAQCDSDTIINLTNHAFFNLGGQHCSSVLGHLMQINADCITSVADRACIPTGKLMQVAGSPLDFTSLRKIGARIDELDSCEQLRYGNGYDHNYVLKDWDGSLRRAAVTIEPISGRVMETWTDAPGVQFYSGNGLGNYPHTRGKQAVPYQKHQAFCLETQNFPDAINHPEFPTCVLKAGDVYMSHTEYRFFTDNDLHRSDG